MRNKLETVRKGLSRLRNPQFTQCVEAARLLYQELYYNASMKILYHFPLNYRDHSGNLFWSGVRLAPQPIAFDAEDPVINSIFWFGLLSFSTQ